MIKVKIIAWRLVHSPAHRNETELGEGPQTGALGGTFYAQSLNLLPRTCAFPLSPGAHLKPFQLLHHSGQTGMTQLLILQ